MEKTTGLYIPVHRTDHSHLDEVDWDNPELGIYHSDHMLVCDYAEGRFIGKGQGSGSFWGGDGGCCLTNRVDRYRWEGLYTPWRECGDGAEAAIG